MLDPSLIQRLREWLSYDPESGLFRWLRSPRYGISPGDLAGSRNNRGYVHLSALGGKVLAHRLAWAFTYGNWPVNGIDHINGNKADNRIANLRDVPQSTNMQNQRKAQRNNKTGLLGVSPLAGRFAAHITTPQGKRYLGLHMTPEAAHDAYVRAKRALHAGCAI